MTVTTKLDSIEPTELARCLFEESRDALFVFDPREMGLIDVNPAAGKLTGIPPHRLVDRGLIELFDAVDRQRFDELLSACKRAQTFRPAETYLLRREAAGPLPVHVMVRPLATGEGPLGILTVREISDRTSETQREDAERSSLVMMVQVGLDGRWQELPDTLCDFLGYSREELLAGLCRDVTHADDRAEDSRQIKQLIDGASKSFEREKRYVRKDGVVVWAYVNCTLVRNLDGVPSHFLTYIRDISKQKHAEERLRESEAKYRSLVEFAPVCIHGINLSGRLSSINPTGMEMIAVDDASEVIGREYLSFIAEPDRARVKDLLNKAFQGQASFFEFHCIVNGDPRRFSSSLIPIFAEDGSVISLTGTTQDITESHEFICRLQTQDLAINSAALGITIMDASSADMPIIQCNPAFERITGFTSEEVIGKNCRFLHAGDRDQEGVRSLRNALAQGHECTAVIRNYRKDGSLFWNEVSIAPLRDQSGNVTHYVGFQNDITERIDMQLKLQESESRFRTIFEQAAMGVALIDTKTGRFVRVNKKYSQLIGYPQDELVERTFSDITFPEDWTGDHLANMRHLHAGEITELTMEKRLVRKDGSLVWVKLTVSPTWQPGSEGRFHIAIVEDITVRKRTERQLAASRKALEDAQSRACLGSWEFYPDQNQAIWSREMHRLLNHDPALSVPVAIDEVMELVHPDDRAQILRYQHLIWETNQPIESIDVRTNPAKGPLRWLNASATRVPCNDCCERFYVAGTLMDITVRKQAEQAMQQSERQLRAVTDNTPALIGYIDKHLCYQFNNAAYEAVYNCSVERMKGRPLVEMIGDDALLRRTPYIEQVLAGQHVEFEGTFERHDGSRFDCHTTLVPDVDESGETVGFYALTQDISQSKKAHSEIRESELKFRTLCTHAPIGIFLTDVDGRCDYMNDTGCRITGQSAAQSAGDGWVTALHPDDRDRVRNAWNEYHEKTVAFDLETRFLHSDGRIVWARVRANARYDDEGRIVGHVGSLVDVTERKNTMQELRQSEYRYRSLINSAPEAIFVFDMDAGRFVEFNENAKSMFKCSAEMLSASELWNFFPEFQPDRRRSIDAAQKLIDGALAGETVVCEWMYRDSNGREFPADMRLTCIAEDGQRLVRGSLTDITERKIAEQQLRMTRFAVESTYDAMYVIDRDGKFVDVNQVACERLGYTRQELLQMGVPDINPQYPMHKWCAHWDDIKAQGKLVFESEHTSRDGTRLPVEISKSYFEFEGKEYAFAFARDITERKQAELQLRITQTAIDQNHGAITRINSAGRFTYVNESVCDHLGYSREELLGMHVWDIDSSWIRETWTNDWLRLKTEGLSTFRTVHKRKDGTYYPVEVTANYFIMGGEEFVFTFSNDLTERDLAESRLRERENQLAHVSRLSTMGEMVAGIAHEVNQPLYSIVNFSKAVNNALNVPANCDLKQIADWNQQIAAAANRAGQIIKRLRAFVSQQQTNWTSINVCQLIADAIEFVRYESNRSGVTVDFESADGGIYVNVDSVQTQQVLVNLLINAIEAMERDQCKRRQIVISAATSTDQVEISISDSGNGLPERQQSSIFDAFVSTKPNGMGMGLAISQTIIESFGGHLWASNNEQGGATFHFSLPRVSEVTTHD